MKEKIEKLTRLDVTCYKNNVYSVFNGVLSETLPGYKQVDMAILGSQMSFKY